MSGFGLHHTVTGTVVGMEMKSAPNTLEYYCMHLQGN